MESGQLGAALDGAAGAVGEMQYAAGVYEGCTERAVGDGLASVGELWPHELRDPLLRYADLVRAQTAVQTESLDSYKAFANDLAKLKELQGDTEVLRGLADAVDRYAAKRIEAAEAVAASAREMSALADSIAVGEDPSIGRLLKVIDELRFAVVD